MNEPHEEQISMSYKYFTNHKKISSLVRTSVHKEKTKQLTYRL